MTTGLSYFHLAYIFLSILYSLPFIPTLFIRFVKLLSLISHIYFPYNFFLHKRCLALVSIFFPQNASLTLHSLCLFCTITDMSKYIGSSLYSPNNLLQEAANFIFQANNFNPSSHKYLNDDSLYNIFIKAGAFFGVLVLNKHSSQQCNSPI